LLLASDGAAGAGHILSPGYVAQMSEASPVHPGYGFGYLLVTPPGQESHLRLETTGRRLDIAPHTGRAVLWVGRGAPPDWLESLLSPMQFPLDDSGIAE
jgi:hypothetical protein